MMSESLCTFLGIRNVFKSISRFKSLLFEEIITTILFWLMVRVQVRKKIKRYLKPQKY